MAGRAQSDVIRRFRERVGRGDLRGLQVTYRVSGGMPAEGRAGQELRVSGEGASTARSLTGGSGSRAPQEASTRLRPQEVGPLFAQLAQGLDSLTPRSQARFVPDSVVGSITVEVDGVEETRYFLADAEERVSQGAPLEPAATDSVDRLARVTARLLGEGL
jgi:hypothetical protein